MAVPRLSASRVRTVAQGDFLGGLAYDLSADAGKCGFVNTTNLLSKK